MASFGRADHWDAGLFLMFPSFAVAILFTLAISFLVAAVNVRYRDTSHVVEVVLIAGMWLNPIVYSLNQLRGPLIRNHLWDIYFLNPIADVILSMQRAFYGSGSVLKSRPGPVHAGGLAPDGVLPDEGLMFYVERLAIGGLISVVLLVLFYRLYNKMSADFAEEL
jgi:ABC-2 type transport system permease protein